MLLPILLLLSSTLVGEISSRLPAATLAAAAAAQRISLSVQEGRRLTTCVTQDKKMVVEKGLPTSEGAVGVSAAHKNVRPVCLYTAVGRLPVLPPRLASTAVSQLDRRLPVLHNR